MRSRILALFVLLAVSYGTASAQAAREVPAGLRGDVTAFIDREGDKYIALAEAIPADKYAWRPAEGVRSISEVLMHVAGANYFFPTFLGGAIPEGIDPRSFEKNVTEKEQVIRQLRASFEHLRGSVVAVQDADLEKELTLFGSPSTQRGVLLLTNNHLAEHMGQLIAYARMNAVAPPWSE